MHMVQSGVVWCMLCNVVSGCGVCSVCVCGMAWRDQTPVVCVKSVSHE